MTDRRARVMMVGLILAFPWLMVGMAPASWSSSNLLTLGVVETMLVGGLLTAATERTRLLAERTQSDAPARSTAPSLPHVRTAGAARKARTRVGIAPR